MAQLVVAAAGAAIGFAVGGPAGARWGWMIGSMVGSALAPGQKSEGPRLGDLQVSGSQYGAVIPYVQGHPRLAGQIIWASTKREISTTTEEGKGGGAEYTSYTYEVDLLILLTDNPIGGVTRIWSNGDLIWSALGGVESSMASGATSHWRRMTPYTGAADQLPDPTYEAAVGTENAPAYRGRGTVMIEALQLGGGGQIPNLTFEIGTAVSGQVACLQHFNVPGVVTYRGPYEPNPTVTVTTHTGVTAAVGPTWTLEAWGGTGNFSPDDDSAIYNNDTRIRAPGVLGERALYLQSGGKSLIELGTAWAEMDSSFDVPAGGDFTFEMIHDAVDPLANQGLYASGSSGTCVQIGAQAALTNVFSGTGRAYLFVVGGSGVQGPDCSGRVRVGVSRQGGTLRMFYDGALVASSAGSAGAIAGSGYINVGSSGPGPYAFNDRAPGIYDELFYVTGVALFTADYLPAADEYGSANSVGVGAVANLTLAQSVSELCLRSGLSAAQFDVSALASITRPVQALAISQVSSARAVLDMLSSAYFFDSVLSDKIYFRPRGGEPVAAIPYDDLGVGLDGASADVLTLKQSNDLEIPAQIAVTYSNVDGDYQPDTQYSDRLLTGQESTGAIQLPLAFSASEAKQISEAMLMDHVAGALTTSISVSRRYTRLEPTDVVTLLDADGSTYRARLMRRTEADGVLTLDAVIDDASVLLQAGVTSGGTPSQVSVSVIPGTRLELLDIPMLRDVDNQLGLYAAARSAGSGASWPGAIVMQSRNAVEYETVADLADAAVIGAATTALPNYTGGNFFDEASTVTVAIGAGQLASSTHDTMLADRAVNVVLVGAEIVRFRVAELVSAGVYTLSGLLRGQLGTEGAMAAHAAGERVVLLRPAGLRRIAHELTDLNVPLTYKGVTRGLKLSSAGAQEVIDTGAALKPLAPYDLRVDAPVGGVATFTWQRRSRLVDNWLLGAVPLGESSERYDVELMDAGGAIIASDTVTNPSWDGPAGFAQASKLSGRAMSYVFAVGDAYYGLVVGFGDTLPRLTAISKSGALLLQSSILDDVAETMIYAAGSFYSAVCDLLENPDPTDPYGIYGVSRVIRLTASPIAVAATYTATLRGDARGIAHDGEYLWVTEYFSDKLQKLNAATLVPVSSYDVIGGPAEIFYSAGYLYISCIFHLAKVNAGTGAEVWRVSLAGRPSGLYVAGALVFCTVGSSAAVYSADNGGVISLVDFGISSINIRVKPFEGAVIFSYTGFQDDVYEHGVLTLDENTGAEVGRTPTDGGVLVGVDGENVIYSDGYDLTTYRRAGSSSWATLTVYQLSDIVGRGHPASRTF